MKSCICGERSNFEFIATNDVGFDHNRYIGKKTFKKYRLCKTCNSIIRFDKDILNPFENEYLYSAKSCKTASQRLNQISKFISDFVKEDIYHICDFGGADGQLLNIISNKYSEASLSAIELNIENQFKKGINYFCSIKEAAYSKKIDILIASNSLLYTNYEELISIIKNTSQRPKFIFITGPDFLKRPAQLFYDDVLYNGSIHGIKMLLERFNYQTYEASDKYISNNEYLIAGVLLNNKETKILKHPEQKFDLKIQKEVILNSYSEQARKANQKGSIIIFGTSIDSAILCSFLKNKYIFTKDITYFNETFINRNVYPLNELSGEVVVPILMNNRKEIIKKLREKNSKLEIED